MISESFASINVCTMDSASQLVQIWLIQRFAGSINPCIIEEHFYV